MIPLSKGNRPPLPLPRLAPWSHLWFPLLVLVVSLATTFFLWRIIDRGTVARAEQRFQNEAGEISSQIIKRLHDHEQVLLGANALFHVKGDAVTRSDWRHYVTALQLDQKHPGILGVGYSVWLTPTQLETNTWEIRAEGFPEYHVHPPGQRPAYTSIIWLEPFNWRNQRAFGYDMYSEPVRRSAMDRARDTGMTSVAARVRLLQETEQDPQLGLLMYVPSYRQTLPTATIAERRAALRGFVYSPLRVNDFVFGTLDKLPSDLDFEIHAGMIPTDQNLLFSSRLVANRPPLPADYRPAFTTTTTISAYGVDWCFAFSTRPPFDREFDRDKPLATLFAGILSSLLLSSLAFVHARSRRQAMVVAGQMAEQLAARQKLALHVEQTPLAAIEWDEQFRVTAWNRAAERIFGYPAAAALGRHATFIIPEPERETVGRVLTDLLANRGGRTSTNRNVTSDGRVIECDWYNTPLIDQDGTVIGVASLAQDITDRLQAEARLREAMERLRLATEAAEVGIWSWNFSDDRFEWDERLCSMYEIPAATREAGLYFDFWRSRLHPDDLARTEELVLEARRNGVPWQSEFRIVLPGGRIRHLRAAAVIEYDHQRQPLRMVGVNRDVTRQRELEESLRNAIQEAELARTEAEQASRAKSDFLSTMSHEIRTPMTVFMGAIEQLRFIDSNPEHEQLLDLADQASKRLYALVNEILDFSKIEARRVDLEERWFNLRECLQETVTMMAARAREKGLHLELEVEAAVPESIVGDQLRLEQILINLLGNAVKFTDAGELRVAVRRRDGSLEFAVSDTGIGIPVDKQGHIFETFSQVDSSSTRRHGGTGLGLAICRGLVELMGGRIGVRSRPGEGSVFTFTLPLKELPPLVEPGVEGCAGGPAAAVPAARILLAEDNLLVREMVLVALARRPWQTTTAETGREALRKWQTGRFDLILMDLQMPEMDGLAATREIRRLEAGRGRRVGIIGLTAHADLAAREECLAAGMDEVLIKPFESAALYAAIERHLAG